MNLLMGWAPLKHIDAKTKKTRGPAAVQVKAPKMLGPAMFISDPAAPKPSLNPADYIWLLGYEYCRVCVIL